VAEETQGDLRGQEHSRSRVTAALSLENGFRISDFGFEIYDAGTSVVSLNGLPAIENHWCFEARVTP